MGIVINRPLSITIRDLLLELSITPGDCAVESKSVLNGGPVGTEQGFIIHDSSAAWKSTLTLSESLYLTTSIDILEHHSETGKPFHMLVALGYAGWGPGQLEREIAENSWLVVPATSSLLFETDHNEQWYAAGREIGIDLNLISSISGHG